MKFSTAATSAVLLSGLGNTANAFSSPHPVAQQRQRRAQTTRLDLFPIESSSILTSNEIVDSLGALALLGSIGFGVVGGKENKDWNYDYKVGNELSEGGSLGSSGTAVLEKVEEETAAEEPEAVVEVEKPKAKKPKVETPKVEKPKVEKPKVEAPKVEAPKPAAPEPAKASSPSAALLESAEKAKAEVQKVGVEETKAKISAKTENASSSQTDVSTLTAAPKPEVAEVPEEEPGAKRQIKKGIVLILAAGAVAVARNVMRAYLGRGML